MFLKTNKKSFWDFSFYAVLATSAATDHTIISQLSLMIFLLTSVYYICKSKGTKVGFVFWIYTLFIILGYFNLETANSIDPIGTKKILKTMTLNLFFIFCCYKYFCLKDIESLKKCIIRATIICATCVFAVSVIRTGGIFLREDMAVIGINSNTTAVLCAFAVILILTLNKRPKNFFLSISYLILFCILAGTRKAFLVIIIGYITYKLISKPSKIIKNITISLFLIIILYICLMKIPFIYENIGYRFETLFIMSQGGEGEGSEESRAKMIENAMLLYSQNPIYGYGLDTFRSIYGKYSHNNYTEILFSLGIPGIIVYYSMFVVILFLSIKRRIQLKLAQYSLAIALTFSYLVMDYAIVSYYSRTCLVLILMLSAFIQRSKSYT